jgi:hypothetical protein
VTRQVNENARRAADLRWQCPVGLRQLRHAYPGYL